MKIEEFMKYWGPRDETGGLFYGAFYKDLEKLIAHACASERRRIAREIRAEKKEWPGHDWVPMEQCARIASRKVKV